MAQQPQGMRNSPQAQAQPGQRPKILRIGVILGGKIVEERLVRKRENVTIGQSAKNTFSIPAPELPRSWILFQVINGRYVLQVAEGMDGRLSDGAQVIPLAQVKTSGHAQKTGAGWQVPLSDSARGKVILGDMTLLFQFVIAPPLQPKPQLPHSVRGSLADRIDPYMAVILTLSLIAHGSFGMYIYKMDRPKAIAPDELPDRYPALRTPLPTKVPPPPKKAETGKQGSVATTEGTPAKKKEPQGKVEPKPAKSTDPVGEAASAGEGGKPDVTAVAQAVENSWVIKGLGARSSGGAGQLVDTTGGKDLGNDLAASLNSAARSGASIVKTGPGSGLGTRDQSGQIGEGSGTAIAGPTGPAGVDVKKVETEIAVDIRAERPEAIESGGLDPNKLVATIKSRYYGGIKQCYQQALKKDPSLQGKVVFRLGIGQLGNVTKAGVDGFDDELNACIEGRARGWRFDKPEEGSAEFEFSFILHSGS